MAILVGAVALVAAEGAGTSPAVAAARSCAQKAAFFNVHILGDRNGDYLFNFHAARLGIPDREAFVAVWSYGGPASTGGLALYAWDTRTRTHLSTLCSAARPSRTATRGSLRAPVSVKNGWNYGRRFACLQPGRFRVEVHEFAARKRVTLRMERTGELIATAEVTAKGASLRGSTRCDARS